MTIHGIEVSRGLDRSLLSDHFWHQLEWCAIVEYVRMNDLAKHQVASTLAGLSDKKKSTYLEVMRNLSLETCLENFIYRVFWENSDDESRPLYGKEEVEYE